MDRKGMTQTQMTPKRLAEIEELHRTRRLHSGGIDAHYEMVGLLLAEIREITRERDEALKEKLEQARLNVRGGLREAKLMAERDQAIRERDESKQMIEVLTEKINDVIERNIDLEKERYRYRDQNSKLKEVIQPLINEIMEWKACGYWDSYDAFIVKRANEAIQADDEAGKG